MSMFHIGNKILSTFANSGVRICHGFIDGVRVYSCDEAPGGPSIIKLYQNYIQSTTYKIIPVSIPGSTGGNYQNYIQVAVQKVPF